MNKHGVFATKVGAAGSAVVGGTIATGYAIKPKEFIDFVSNNLYGNAALITSAAVAVIAILMYLAYRHSQKKERVQEFSSLLGGDFTDSEELLNGLERIDHDSMSRPGNNSPHYGPSQSNIALSPTQSLINSFTGS